MKIHSYLITCTSSLATSSSTIARSRSSRTAAARRRRGHIPTQNVGPLFRPSTRYSSPLVVMLFESTLRYLNTRVAYHLRPPCKLAADPFAQLLRRAARNRLHANHLDVLAELGVRQRPFHLRVELVDDGRGRAGGREDSVPPVVGESRQRLGNGGQRGHAAQSLDVAGRDRADSPRRDLRLSGG